MLLSKEFINLLWYKKLKNELILFILVRSMRIGMYYDDFVFIFNFNSCILGIIFMFF